MAVKSAPEASSTVKPRTPRRKADPLAEALRKDGDEATHPPIRMPRDWADAEAYLESGIDRVLLHGIPGTGKSYTPQHHTLRGEKPQVYSIYLGEETAAFQVIGTDYMEDGNQKWRNGPALLFWRTGGRLVINELDHAGGDALDALLWICDDAGTRRMGVVLPTGETVYPFDEGPFQIVATMNGEPEDLPEALAERFVTRVRIGRPHPHAIRALPQNLWAIAEELTKEETPASQRVTIRQFRSFAEAIKLGVPSGTAARGAFHHRADELLKTITLAAAEA